MTAKTQRQSQQTILVGTYRKDQLKKWILPQGLHNYPIHDADGHKKQV